MEAHPGRQVQAGKQQQEQEMELRAEAALVSAPAVRPVGRPRMGPATCPAPAPERQVFRPSASTHVQAPPAEPERLRGSRVVLVVADSLGGPQRRSSNDSRDVCRPGSIC
eukprot:802187-Pelagomonas_calceolata.AAC.2